MSELNEDELTPNTLIEIQENLALNNKMLIIKFSAEWCAPCRKIKDIVHENVKKLNENIIFVELDIDESLELYGTLKTKKMVKGIPCILAYMGNKNRDVSKWYIPDDSVSGSNFEEINAFFERCNKKVI